MARPDQFVAAEQRFVLWDLFGVPTVLPVRDPLVQSARLRLVTQLGARVVGALGSAGASALVGEGVPNSSYQWLFFNTISGNDPVGSQSFTFFGPAIPFAGAITEVDVVATDPGDQWHMRLSVDTVGTIFRTSQPTDVLIEDGWFRPTPPGFWPETEGLVFTLPASGLVPQIQLRRLSDTAPNLTLRVLIVAQPTG